MKEKKSFLLVYAVCALSVLTCSYVSIGATVAGELSFGPVVSGLAGTGIVASPSNIAATPLAKNSSSGINQEIIHFSLDTSQTSLKTVRNKDYVKIEGLKPYGSPGEPQLPFKSFVMSLPKDSKVSSVTVSSVAYRPVLKKLDIVANPMPISNAKINKTANIDRRQAKDSLTKQNTSEGQAPDVNKSYSKCKTCDSEDFLPGNLVSYITGRNNDNYLVFIKFFPLQYIPNSGRAILITDADITVNYQITDSKRKPE